MAIAIHPHANPRNHSTRLYLLMQSLVLSLIVFCDWGAGLWGESRLKVVGLFLGAIYDWYEVYSSGGVGLVVLVVLCVRELDGL
jgi:hypothetical protein